MAKICILEDDVYDLVERYSGLVKTEKEVYPILCFTYDPDEHKSETTNKNLVKAGFDLNKVGYEHIEDNKRVVPFPSDADIYFIDGLKGRCLKIAELIGKEKVIINTDDSGIETLAKEKGFRTREGKSLTEIISHLG